MVVSKSTQTRVVGIMTDKVHPTSYISSNRVSMKKSVGMHLVSYYSSSCTFDPTIPTYVYNLFSCFLYLFALLFLAEVLCINNELGNTNIRHATAAEGCGCSVV